MKRTNDDLYVCLGWLMKPSSATRGGPNAVVYINRTGTPGQQPGPDDIAYEISFDGRVTVMQGVAGAWSRSDYDYPAPGAFSVRRRELYSSDTGEEWWDAEFRINLATLGGGGNRDIRIAVAQQWINSIGDDRGWPPGYYYLTPNSWGVGRLAGPRPSPP
jgi:hypothetical protein